MKTETTEVLHKNRDPLSGALGAHPVGTGIGAVAGGAADAHDSQSLSRHRARVYRGFGWDLVRKSSGQ